MLSLDCFLQFWGFIKLYNFLNRTVCSCFREIHLSEQMNVIMSLQLKANWTCFCKNAYKPLFCFGSITYCTLHVQCSLHMWKLHYLMGKK